MKWIKTLSPLLIAGCLFSVASISFGAQGPIKVKIGVLTDLSGPYAAESGDGAVDAVKMAARDAVRETGVKMDVEVISADHQNNPSLGSAIARQWYDTDGVDMIIALPTSSVALAVSQITKEKNKVAIPVDAGSTSLTGDQCTPNTVQWLYDTWERAHSTGRQIVERGGKSWFFITADYVFGKQLESDTAAVVKENGGTVLGSVRVPLGNLDYSSFLLTAQSSHAQVIGLADSSMDTVNSIKQAHEFGITTGGQKLAALTLWFTDIPAMGLNMAQGLLLTTEFYWNLNDRTRAFAKEFEAFRGKPVPPSESNAGDYAGTLHYLKAVAKLGSSHDGRAVVAEMKTMPTDDAAFGVGSVREDGRVLHNAYLFQVKSPAESKSKWDFYKLVATTPAKDAFRPLSESDCPLVKKK